MTEDWIKQFYGALAEELKRRFPKAIIYRTSIFGDDCVEITLDLQQYQIVFEGPLKIVRYHKSHSENPKFSGYIRKTHRVYRDCIKEYDITDPDADLEPLYADLRIALDETLDDS